MQWQTHDLYLPQMVNAIYKLPEQVQFLSHIGAGEAWHPLISTSMEELDLDL